MASPFRAFRKHQKQWLAILGVLTMFSFVFLPIILDRFSGGSRATKDTPVVTTTRYGSLNEFDLQRLRQQRQTALNFLNHAAAMIRERGGFARDAMQMANEIGSVDEESTVTGWLLLQRARELGIVVSNDSVKASLQTMMRGFAFSQPAKDSKDAKPQLREIRLDTKDLKNILRNLRVSSSQFLEIWRAELITQALIREFAFSLDGMPPGQRWDYFQRFSRRATVEVLPVSVDSFVQSQETPDEATLKKYFEEHKNRLALPGSPLPGFRQPHQIAVEYLKADQNKYVDRAAVTDKEIAEYYDQFKEIYYREEPAKPTPKQEVVPSAAVQPKPEASAPKKTEPTKPAPPAKPQEATKAAAPSKPETRPPATEKPAQAKAADKSAPSKPEQKPATGSPSKPSSEGKAGAATNKSSSATPRSIYHFAAFQAKEAAKPASSPAAPTAKPAAKSDASASKTEPAAAKSAVPTAQPKEPAEKKVSPLPTTTAPEPPKYIPLEKVKERIRDTLAQRQANAKMQKALVGLQDILHEYHQKWLNWKVAETTRTKGEPLPQPSPPDLKNLAKQYDLVYQQIPPVSAWDIKGFDISSSNVTTGIAEAGGGSPFIAYAFETLTEFRPTISQDTAGNAYLFWKTQDIAERVPAFEDPGIADQVLATWKRVQARAAASKRAAELKEEADKAQQSLTKLFGTRPGFVVTKTEPFAWITFGALPARFATEQSRPQISEVQGVEQPGNQFMRTVFGMSPGEYAVAPNQAETIYYVIRAVDFTPSPDELWNTFRDGADMQSIYRVAAEDQQETMRAWMNALKTLAGVKWERDPQRGREE